jgi:MFS transporter, DHA2 family, multidrug resistance protein
MSPKERPAADALTRSAAGDRNPWLVAVVVSIATFMQVLDTSIANVALQYIAGSMAASVDESTWVLTSYLVASAVILPISGWLSGVVGRKRLYMGCVAMFTVSSVLCALAPNLQTLIVFRVLQGIGGGGMAPSEQAMLADTFPENKRPLAFALYGVAVLVAPTVGPTLGGWLTDNLSWHWIFLINGPIGAVSLVHQKANAKMTNKIVKAPANNPAWKRSLQRPSKIELLGCEFEFSS